jgi:tetratricopeptide (TPR) repeat protein
VRHHPSRTHNVPGRTARALAVLLLGMAGAPALFGQTAAPPEVPETAQAEIRAAQDAEARAVAAFEGPQQSRSIVLFDEVIARLETLAAVEKPLPAAARDVLAEAYAYRGRAYFTIGLQEKASENFRQLVLLRPDFVLSKEEVSPKIVELFESVKKSLIGYLAVATRPAGARVTLVGAGGDRLDLGLTDFFPVDVLAGEYTLEVAKEGYETVSEPLSLAPRATEARQFDLVRVLASAFFVTQPPDVEIWIDGELRATTSGVLEPERYAAARERGLDPGRASARVEVPNLSLGNHAVEFRRRCYQTEKRTLPTPLPQDYEVEPIRLEDSLASLNLTSDPPGGRIYIDGEPQGVTPKQIDGICSGKVRVEVKHAAGKYIKDVVLAKDESVSLECSIRPTLAFLGVVAEGSTGERNAAEAEERIVETLNSSLKSVNFIEAPREATDRILGQEGATRSSLLPGPDRAADLVRRVSDRLASALEVQGFVLAVLPEEDRLQRTARLHVLANGSTTTETLDVVYNESASYLSALERLDRRFESQRTWSGLITVDTLSFDSPPVLRVVAGSPAAAAGVIPGERVLSVDGQPVKQTAELRAAVRAKKPGDRLSVRLQGPAGERTLDLTLAETPREIPLNDPALLYNKAMVDLRAVVEGYPGTEQAAFAWLNLGLCAMHFGDFAGAHDWLQKAQAVLPVRPGLSQGTALYYMGLALERLNYAPQAREAYRQAAAAEGATLIDNDGPLLAPLAAQRAEP